MMLGSFLRAGRGAAAVHVGRSLTRRKLYTSDILQLKQEMLLSTSDPFSDERRLHVGLSNFFLQVVLFTSAHLPTSCALPLAPRATQLVNKSCKSSCKTHVFLLEKLLIAALFRRFWKVLEIFYLKTAIERYLSPQNCCALGPRAFFYS